jgi:hypothetical protein
MAKQAATKLAANFNELFMIFTLDAFKYEKDTANCPTL